MNLYFGKFDVYYLYVYIKGILFFLIKKYKIIFLYSNYVNIFINIVFYEMILQYIVIFIFLLVYCLLKMFILELMEKFIVY